MDLTGLGYGKLQGHF